MTVRIDPSHIFTDMAVTDPDELRNIWTDSIASEQVEQTENAPGDRSDSSAAST